MALWGRYYYTHFKYREIQALEKLNNSSIPQSLYVEEVRSNPDLSASTDCVWTIQLAYSSEYCLPFLCDAGAREHLSAPGIRDAFAFPETHYTGGFSLDCGGTIVVVVLQLLSCVRLFATPWTADSTVEQLPFLNWTLPENTECIT